MDPTYSLVEILRQTQETQWAMTYVESFSENSKKLNTL